MADKLNQLLEIADAADQAELKILHNSQIKCARAYNDEPTLAKKRDWDAAKSGLQETVDRLWIKYSGSDEGHVPQNRLEAVNYLQRRGYKVGKSKFYADCKRGLVKIQSNGSIIPRDLETYAVKIGLDRFAAPEVVSQVDDVSELHEVKLKKEIEKLDWENKKREFEYDREMGKYIPRDLLELELASRAAVMDSRLRTKIKARVKKWIALAGGSQAKVPDVVADAFDMLDQVMNEFARMDRFVVIFGDENEGVEAEEGIEGLGD